MRIRPFPPARRRIGLVIGAAAALITLGGCERRDDVGPVVASAIGGAPVLADPARRSLDLPSHLLLDSVAQGLVRFDAAGQVEPGIAERWIVIDDGLSYIFRLRDAQWSDGKPVTTAQVVTILRREIAPRSRNPLAPFLTAVDEIVAMTPEVIEVRLKRPRPDLLRLFASPDMAVFRVNPPGGSGPFRVGERTRTTVLLRPAPEPADGGEDEPSAPPPERNVRLIGERAARAIVRFEQKRSDLVTGGTFADWPLVAAADLPAADLHLDPAAGLFGLAIAHRTGFLESAENRNAIAGAIDRDAIRALFAPGWESADSILPDRLDSAAVPSVPGWLAGRLDNRRAAARARVAIWQGDHPAPLTMRIALPAGPGATLLYGAIGASLAAIGITAERVAIDADADLRLIDAVAPLDSARWYLATACAACSDEAAAALESARLAPNLSDRAQAIAAADTALAADGAFIPIARPLRWSLVAARLDQWQANARAWHPLNHLRSDTR